MPTRDEAEILDRTVRVSEILAYLAEDGFLPRRAAAQFCGVNWRTLESQPGLPSYRVGKKIVYKKSELISWVTSHRVHSSDPAPEKNDLRALMDSALTKVRARSAAQRNGGRL